MRTSMPVRLAVVVCSAACAAFLNDRHGCVGWLSPERATFESEPGRRLGELSYSREELQYDTEVV